MLLERMHSAVVNLLGVGLEDRPAVASELFRKLEHLRAHKGRPHWFVIDEAHHIFPSDFPTGSTLLPAPPKASLMITVHPQHVRRDALAAVDILIAVGKNADETIRQFCHALEIGEPPLQPANLQRGEVLVWFRKGQEPPFVVEAEPGRTEHARHIRKYAEGDLGDGSFVFRGPEGKLNLVAQNLNTFVRMAEGVDDETWCHHLRSGDLSRWFRSIVKNESLADLVRSLESEKCSARETRVQVIKKIRDEYTAPS
jgi:hypothetical protein